MKTTSDIEQDVFYLVSLSPIAVNVNGNIYKGVRRPDDSVKEDVTIKVLANDINEDEQVAFVNVNIYVRDKPFGKSYDENKERIDKLTSIAFGVLHKGGHGKDFRTTVESQNVFQVEGSKNPEHQINFKVRYKHSNT